MQLLPTSVQSFFTSLVLVFLMGCQHSHLCPYKESQTSSTHLRPPVLFPWSCPAYTGGNGSGVDQAIIITQTSVQFLAGNVKEAWLNCHYPGGAIREVSTRIVHNRVIQVISIQAPTKEIVQVYFDVTSTVAQPSLGVWFFVDSDGIGCTGMIDEEYLRNINPEPWQELVGTNNGTLIYQVDDEIGNGLLGTGAVRHGRKHGTWRYERLIEGAILVEYDMGTKVSEERLPY